MPSCVGHVATPGIHSVRFDKVSPQRLCIEQLFDAAGGAGRGMGSVMTLRVGKTDLDSLGAGRLKPDEFGSKVRVANRLETPGEPEPKPEEGARKRRPGR